MKELIDIPDELYEAYKGRPPRTGDEGMDMIAQAIANGTPLQDGEFLLTLMQSVMTPEQLNEVLQKMSERPQGEWIYGEDDCGQDGWFCSECNFFVPWYYQYYEDIDFIRDYKVCPHCLAEMVTYTGKDTDKKGGAEE